MLTVLDVGGMSIKLGAVHDGLAVVGDPVPALSDRSAPTVLGQLATAAQRALDVAATVESGPVAGLVIAFPGPFDLDAGRPMLVGEQKFGAIHGVDLRAELRARLELAATPIVFVRDSEAVGVGEAVFGAGRGAERVLTVALGTGFGSCLTDRGVVVERVGSQVIERLHELDTPDGRVDDVLSARGFDALVSFGGDDDDSAATAAFGMRLGTFLDRIDSTLALGLDLVVVAGGVAGSFDRFVGALSSSSGLRCVPAELGAAGALLGAAAISQSGQPGTDVTALDVPTPQIR